MVTLQPKILTLVMVCAIEYLAFFQECRYEGLIRVSGQAAAVLPNASDESEKRMIINELMVDPTPLVGLPDFEWIELFNSGNTRVNLAGWRITVGTTSRVLTECWLDPGEFIILCSSVASGILSEWGRTLVVSLPALRNSGNRIVLYDSENRSADEVNYTDKWYNDTRKRGGGWTLERIDPMRSCGEAANWTASIAPQGGTPGAENSVFADNRDEIMPEVIRVTLTSLHTAGIEFSEPMDVSQLSRDVNYRLQGIHTPIRANSAGETFVMLEWDTALEVNVSYLLTLENLSDLCGNMLKENTFSLEWVELAEGDVLINEVLFNPWPGGVDFVELYNRSRKRIDPGMLVLAGRDRQLKLRQQVSLNAAGNLIGPGEYLAVTINRQNILSSYPSVCPQCVAQIPFMPAYNNDEGWVVLMDASGQIIDELHYTEKMHHPLLFNVKGVSLERVHPGKPADLPGNWQSASPESGFATPGYRNSQYGTDISGRAKISPTEKYFTPDGDGINDELIVCYETSGPGWLANAWIFDIHGNMVLQLLRNRMLPVSGVISWNGKGNTGSMMPPGPYILIVEMYDLSGGLEKFRHAVYLSGSP